MTGSHKADDDETPESVTQGRQVYSSIQQVSPDALLHHLLGADQKDFLATMEGELFSYSIALIALKRGLHVARASWKISGKYVFLQPGEEMLDPESGQPVPIKAHLVWKNGDGEFVPWTASQDATLANDWFVGKSGDRGEFPGGDALVDVVTFDKDGDEVRHGAMRIPVSSLDAALAGGYSDTDSSDGDCMTVTLGDARRGGISIHLHREGI